jgi:hypothetical protein
MNNLEYDALEDERLPHEARTLYVMCIRRFMDYDTGLTGIKRRVSYQMFKERLEVHRPPRSPIPSFIPTKKQLRGYVDHLERVGLIEKLPQAKERDPMVFRCLLATTDSVRFQEEGHKQGTSPGHVEGHDVLADAGHSESQQPRALEPEAGHKQELQAGQEEGHSVFSEVGHTSVTSVNTTTSSRAQGAPHDGRSFAMTWDWQPSEGVIRHCRAMRVNWSNLAQQQRDALIDELRSYWVTRPNRFHTQDQWDRKLAQQVVKKRWGGSANETSQSATHGAGKPLSAVDRVRQANRDRYEPYPEGQIIDVN